MVKLELLSPAKNFESGIAAIDHGADAVYIGADRFGAREKAGNSMPAIEKLIVYAHQFNAKVYITINTILFEDELTDVLRLIQEAYRVGADAIIIQDFGILEMDLPPIQIFASTQMHSNNPEKIQFLEKVGLKRVILPREMTLDEIRELQGKTNIELEFFIHGALCVSYSGQCYMSQAITGRSANRGACAQLCRSSYDLVDSTGKILIRNKHLLSLKDLNLSLHLSDLISAGITSFKIEGRLKDIAYVKNITAYYRQLLDNFILSNPGYQKSSSGKSVINFEPDPSRSFNRGFTSHFIKGRQRELSSLVTQKSIGQTLGKVISVTDKWFSMSGKILPANGDGVCFMNSKDELTGLRINKVEGNRIFPFGEFPDLKVGTEIFRNYDLEFNRELSSKSACRYIDCSIVIIQSGEHLRFTATDEDSNSAVVDYLMHGEKARKPDKAIQALKEQLAKTGNSIFRVSDVSVQIATPIFLTISSINSIRRELLEKLTKERERNFQSGTGSVINNREPYPEDNLDYRANISNSLAKRFYKRHRVRKFEEAFEIYPHDGADLMVTRYCIKYELGLCSVKQGAKPTGELYLIENQKTYLLEFDCRNCLMRVKSTGKTS